MCPLRSTWRRRGWSSCSLLSGVLSGTGFTSQALDLLQVSREGISSGSCTKQALCICLPLCHPAQRLAHVQAALRAVCEACPAMLWQPPAGTVHSSRPGQAARRAAPALQQARQPVLPCAYGGSQGVRQASSQHVTSAGGSTACCCGRCPSPWASGCGTPTWPRGGA